MFFIRSFEKLLENSLYKLKSHHWLCLSSTNHNGARKLHLLSLKSNPFKLNRQVAKQFYASSEGDKVRLAAKRHAEDLKTRLQKGKEIIYNSEERLRVKGNVILQDIKDTKSKIKEHVEGIVEKENIYTIPNLLCIARMAASPWLGVLIIQANYDLALGVLIFAAITDLVIVANDKEDIEYIMRQLTEEYQKWGLTVNVDKTQYLCIGNESNESELNNISMQSLDGWIARTWESQSSKMGSFLDPMADKILISTLFLTLTYVDLIPLVLTSLIITRDVLLVGAGFAIRYQSLPPPKTLSRYFDASLATAQLAPTFISKVNTGIQLLLVGTTLAAPVFHYVGHPVLQGLWYVTGVTTLAAGVSYILSRNTYKVLKQSPPEDGPKT